MGGAWQCMEALPGSKTRAIDTQTRAIDTQTRAVDTQLNVTCHHTTPQQHTTATHDKQLQSPPTKTRATDTDKSNRHRQEQQTQTRHRKNTYHTQTIATHTQHDKTPHHSNTQKEHKTPTTNAPGPRYAGIRLPSRPYIISKTPKFKICMSVYETHKTHIGGAQQ